MAAGAHGVTAKARKGRQGRRRRLRARPFDRADGQGIPESRFWGFDAHEESIEIARRVAREAGVADRVSFEVAKADDYARHGYDLICFFDCLHDMGRPVDAARHAKTAMAEDGTSC